MLVHGVVGAFALLTAYAAPVSAGPRTVDCTRSQASSACRLPVLASEQYATDDHDLVNDRAHGRTLLRFANAIGNRGAGALEVYGVRTGASPSTVDDTNNTMPAFQRIFRSDGSYQDVGVGQLVYHPDHNHFHFDGAVSYVLTDDTTSKVVRSSSKVSFCLADVDVVDPSLAGYPKAPRYNSCVHDPYTNSLTMGVSVGWADNYPKDAAGQSFDVTDLMALDPPHTFTMRATVNPAKLLVSGPTSATTSSFTVRIGKGVPLGTGTERPGV